MFPTERIELVAGNNKIVAGSSPATGISFSAKNSLHSWNSCTVSDSLFCDFLLSKFFGCVQSCDPLMMLAKPTWMNPTEHYLGILSAALSAVVTTPACK